MIYYIVQCKNEMGVPVFLDRTGIVGAVTFTKAMWFVSEEAAKGAAERVKGHVISCTFSSAVF